MVTRPGRRNGVGVNGRRGPQPDGGTPRLPTPSAWMRWLPARVLSALLHDRDTAHEAITNPSIPIPVLHRLLAASAAALHGRTSHPAVGQ